MANTPFSAPIGDSVPKVGDVAVGEDLNFQRKWWVFERLVWVFFLLILVADFLGVFGRGWAAKAEMSNAGHTLTVDYERVMRGGTPSTMTLHLSPGLFTMAT